MQFSLPAAVIVLAALVSTVVGETHTVQLNNRCEYGTPKLIQGNKVLSGDGEDFTIHGPLQSVIAYLQTGNCGFNGENCTLIETTLENVAPGNSGSLTGISLISPHKFSVASGFKYYNGCDGQGANCAGKNCPAQHAPVSCKDKDVNLAITFC